MDSEQKQPGSPAEGRFSTVQRIMLVVAALGFAWIARDLLLLLFAAVLLAILLRTAAVFLAERTKLTTGWALVLVVLLLLGAAVGAGLLFAPRLADQVRQLSDTLPQAAGRLIERVRETTFGGWLLDQVGGAGPTEQQDKIVQQATTAATKVLNGVVALAIILFSGIYFAAAPRPYIRGLVRLVPLHRRRRVGEALFATGYTLRWWILGQLLSMTVVGLMMVTGLTLIGVPLAFTLGLLAGLFEFIPVVGPVLGVLPALVLALAEDPQMAIYVLILYSIVQTVEGYLLTPLVQERAIELPPVVTIATQTLFAWTMGPLGLLVAVPVVGTVMVLVEILYVKDFLADRMPVQAEQEGRRELDESGFLEDLV